MNHPNVIKFHEFFESPRHVTLIFDPAPGKPLMEALKAFEGTKTKDRLLDIIFQISKGLFHTKLKNVIWCNFSHKNVIFDGNRITLCNFTAARIKISRTFKIDKRVLGFRGQNFVSERFLNMIRSIFKTEYSECDVLKNDD